MKSLRLARLLLPRFFGDAPEARPTLHQKRTALVIAALADLVQLALAPLFAAGGLSPFDAALDFVVAGLLFLTLGRRGRIALALSLELVPGIALFPSWTAMVATFPTAPELLINPCEESSRVRLSASR